MTSGSTRLAALACEMAPRFGCAHEDAEVQQPDCAAQRQADPEQGQSMHDGACHQAGCGQPHDRAEDRPSKCHRGHAPGIRKCNCRVNLLFGFDLPGPPSFVLASRCRYGRMRHSTTARGIRRARPDLIGADRKNLVALLKSRHPFADVHVTGHGPGASRDSRPTG